MSQRIYHDLHFDNLVDLLRNSGPFILFAINENKVVIRLEGEGLLDLGLASGQYIGESILELNGQVPGAEDNVRRALKGESFSCTEDVGGLLFGIQYSPIRGEEYGIIGVTGIARNLS